MNKKTHKEPCYFIFNKIKSVLQKNKKEQTILLYNSYKKDEINYNLKYFDIDKESLILIKLKNKKVADILQEIINHKSELKMNLFWQITDKHSKLKEIKDLINLKKIYYFN